MPLHWDISKVKDYRDKCFYEVMNEDGTPYIQEGEPVEKMRGVTESLLWATMAIGMSSITQKNYKKFAARLRMWERVVGSYRKRGEENIYVTLEDVEEHIGLGTNASTKTNTEFLKHLEKVSLERLENGTV